MCQTLHQAHFYLLIQKLQNPKQQVLLTPFYI